MAMRDFRNPSISPSTLAISGSMISLFPAEPNGQEAAVPANKTSFITFMVPTCFKYTLKNQ